MPTRRRHALLDALLVTCDADNVVSRRVIEANGGALEDEFDGKPPGYRISL